MPAQTTVIRVPMTRDNPVAFRIRSASRRRYLVIQCRRRRIFFRTDNIDKARASARADTDRLIYDSATAQFIV